MYVCMHACMHVCMYACMYVCVYVCVYVCLLYCLHSNVSTPSSSSMGKTQEHDHKPGIPFYPIGLSDKTETSRGWKLMSYKQILERFNDSQVGHPTCLHS